MCEVNLFLSFQAYHTSRELPSPVVSYDLTARESWPGSDISDSEGNANLVPDSHLPQQFSTTPSFSNTLHSFIPKNASNNSFVGECMLVYLHKVTTIAQLNFECNKLTKPIVLFQLHFLPIFSLKHQWKAIQVLKILAAVLLVVWQ